MRGLAGIADAAAHLEGGALINAVDSLAQHGDPLVQHFVSRTLQQMRQPLFQMAREWVFDGRLNSAGSEFFITSTGVIPLAAHCTACMMMLFHMVHEWVFVSRLNSAGTNASSPAELTVCLGHSVQHEGRGMHANGAAVYLSMQCSRADIGCSICNLPPGLLAQSDAGIICFATSALLLVVHQQSSLLVPMRAGVNPGPQHVHVQ